MTNPIVIYHGGCRDGFCAAWVVHRSYPNAEFVPGYYGQEPPDVAGRWVYILDFSYPRPVLDALAARAAHLVVLDHHATAAAELAGARYAIFAPDRSGARMAWDYFEPGAPIPWLVEYVEDRDLWRRALPNSDEVNAYIATAPFEFGEWDALMNMPLEQAVTLGQVALRKTAQYVREVAKNARWVAFEGYRVLLVNAPQIDISELLDHLAQDAPFAMGWWQRADGIFQYSLRARDDVVDVSVLAQRYGGGGHRKAAGFQVQAPILLGWPAHDEEMR